MDDPYQARSLRFADEHAFQLSEGIDEEEAEAVSADDEWVKWVDGFDLRRIIFQGFLFLLYTWAAYSDLL